MEGRTPDGRVNHSLTAELPLPFFSAETFEEKNRLAGREYPILCSAKPKILITGATGQVDALVISCLKADPSVEVVAAARSLEKAKSLGIPSVCLDLDKPESLAPALEGVERAFLATGYTIDMIVHLGA